MIVVENPQNKVWKDLLKRPTASVADIETTVTEIFKDIQQQGDAAVLKYTDIFDGVKLSKLLVSPEEIQNAKMKVGTELKEAILLAKRNITRFHQAQQTEKIEIETETGVLCWQEKRAIQKNRIIYSRRYSTFIFNSLNVSCSCKNSWL